MELKDKTILITGGASGIGLEIARQLNGNCAGLILVGRDVEKLKATVSELGDVKAIACDITDEDSVRKMHEQLKKANLKIDVLINNAGLALPHSLNDVEYTFELASKEMLVNYLSLIRLTSVFLPELKLSAEAAIVNVSSVSAIAPKVEVPTYSASKAAVHSYTQSLRFTLAAGTNIKVFELMPPRVNTPMTNDITGMLPIDVARALVEGMTQNVYEIYVGKTAAFLEAYLKSPQQAFEALNTK